MADTTVEIYNSTVQFASYSGNAQTLVTTDANTRYVIKDVELDSNTYQSSPTLTINSTKVATLNGNLTGNEIMDVSSTLAINFDTSTSLFFSFNTLDVGAGYAAVGLSSNSGADAIIGASLSAASTASNTASSITPAFTNSVNVRACWFVNGDFYYAVNDGDTVTGLYKRAGGVNGTQTTISSAGSAPVVFDGTSKFYWVDGSANLKVYNALTGTTTTAKSGLPSAGGTYPLLTYCNGFIFWVPSYTYGQVWWYHVASGNSGTTVSGFLSYSSANGWSMFYDSTTQVYRFVFLPRGYTSNTPQYQDIQANATNDQITGLIGSGSLTNNGVQLRGGQMSSLGNNYAIYFGAANSASTYSKVYLVDSAMKIVASKTVSLGSNFPNGFYGSSGYGSGTLQLISSPSTAQKNALGPSMKLRITGVKQV